MLRRLARMARRLGLTTRRCPVCGKLVEDDDHSLCEQCAASLTLRTGGLCPSCGTMWGRNDTPSTLCGTCRRDPPPWDSLYFYNRYHGPLRELILHYKFNNGIGNTRLLGHMAIEAFQSVAQRVPDLVVPVPLHTRRLLWRGYNQSMELATALGKALDRPVSKTALVRTRHTVPQTRLGMRERQKNIKDAFAARTEQVRGKSVLVVDDVYTTGATLRECARTLKRAGAASVDCLVLARTQAD